MSVMTFREALRAAIDEEMARDDSVLLLGEEVGQYNGAYKVSQGLLEKYGPERVIDTPISEEGFTGIGIGAAMAGLRPIVEWMTVNFSLQAMDQIFSNASKMRYMSGGQFSVPIVFRGPNGPAEFLGSQHSQALQSIYAHVPGLKVVAPSNPADAKGLLKASIRDDNPVVFLEAELMYSWKGEVPEGELVIPLGQADIKRPGKDVTLIGFSKPLRMVSGGGGVPCRAGNRCRGRGPEKHPAPGRGRHLRVCAEDQPMRRHRRGVAVCKRRLARRLARIQELL